MTVKLYIRYLLFYTGFKPDLKRQQTFRLGYHLYGAHLYGFAATDSAYRILCAGASSFLLYILYRADLIIGHHDRDERRLFRDRRGILIHIYFAIFIDRQINMAK